MRNDRPTEALKLFHKIRRPNEIILTILFKACAKIRSDEAPELLKKVSSTMPRSYLGDRVLMAALIDALMQCGDVSVAQSFFGQAKEKSSEMYAAMMKGR